MREMLKLALSAMGYREARKDKWYKPVGYHLFTFELDKLQWTNWFRDAQSRISVYESKLFFDEDASDYDKSLSFLKCIEAYTRIGADSSRLSRFEISPDALNLF